MKIALIQCPSWVTESPPYNIALIAASLKNRGHDPVCLDFNIEIYNYCKKNSETGIWLDNERGSCWHDTGFVLALIERFKPHVNKLVNKVLDTGSQVIGFTVYSISQIFSGEFAKMIKEKDPNRILIFGGPECFRNCQGADMLNRKYWIDAVCFGEAEQCLPNLLDMIDIKGNIGPCKGFAYRDNEGKIIDCGDSALIDDLDSLPFADFSYFDLEKYTSQKLPIATSRGCIQRCTFCSESAHWGKYYFRTGKNVYSEIIYQLNKYPSIKEFWFNDSLVNGNIKMLDELCDLIIKNGLHVNWGGQAIVREEMTKQFLTKLRQAGCSILSYGLESGSNKILKLMRKNCNAEIAEKVIRDTHESGIGLTFNIIVGFPGETELEFQETTDFIKRNKIYAKSVPLNPLFVQKGSELYKNRKEWGIEFSEGLNNDLFWRTTDNASNYDERMRRLNICKNLIGDKVATDMDKFSVNKKDFKWYLCYTCNFRCPYCWFYAGWTEAGKRNIYLSPQEWMVHWKRVYDKYGSVRVEITGGEPFIYPNFIELVKLISSIHTVKVTTNMSGDIETFVKEISPKRVNLDLNLHPLFVRDLDAFIRKVLILKEAGFKAGVCYLAYPPQMAKVDYFRKRIEEHGINFALAAFWGEYGGKRYPESYTNEEIEFIRPFLGDIDRIVYHLKGESPKGKLCNAGYKYAVIQADGKVIRCGQLADKIISNFFSDDFNLLDKPEPCEADSCPCNEYVNLI